MKILKNNSKKSGIEIWVYCLMDNHIHFIAVPETIESFARGIGETHRKYTTVINTINNWKGYLWQGRFISYPLDDRYLFTAARYIELNPVKIGLVKQPEEYQWSSARAHILKEKDPLLSDFDIFFEIKDWSNFLNQGLTESEIKQIAEHEKSGRPLGNDEFIRKIEEMTGRTLRKKRPGRRKKEIGIVSPILKNS